MFYPLHTAADRGPSLVQIKLSCNLVPDPQITFINNTCCSTYFDLPKFTSFSHFGVSTWKNKHFITGFKKKSLRLFTYFYFFRLSTGLPNTNFIHQIPSLLSNSTRLTKRSLKHFNYLNISYLSLIFLSFLRPHLNFFYAQRFNKITRRFTPTLTSSSKHFYPHMSHYKSDPLPNHAP